MITSWAQTATDREIVANITEVSGDDSQYWAFRKGAKREGVHGLIRYPAMMVPTMQAKLLDILCDAHGEVQRVLDPFVGGGTMLTESMEQGLDFVGFDINPLAVLACKVKSGPYTVLRLRERIAGLLASINADTGRSYEVSFPNQSKWFTKGASIGLSRIRRAILSEPDLWTRRFLWLSMAETIRRVSNSRPSTYKLHVRPLEEIDMTCGRAVETFGEVVKANVSRVLAQQTVFEQNGVLDQGRYRGQIGVAYQDVAKLSPPENGDRFDLLFTSPPYGDNTTTIPYGQFSFLSLNWIPLRDIDETIPDSVNLNTHAIDSISIGGSLKDSEEKAAGLSRQSRSFTDFYQALPKQNGSYRKRLSAFCFDLEKSIGSLNKMVSDGGYSVWTLGNRSLNGRRVPLDSIVIELAESHGMRRVAQFSRPIPSKRMPNRNNCSDTMHSETVVILGAAD